ncbi:MAG: hypothetical protein ACJ736_28170 [Streptomyces sp.]
MRSGNLPVHATAVKDVVEECGGGPAGCRTIADQLGLRRRAAAGPVIASALGELLAEPGSPLP